MCQKTDQRGPRRRVCHLILVAFVPFFVALACNLPLEASKETLQEGFNLASRKADGTVRGSYLYPTSLKSKHIVFTVSVDGQATYRVDGAADSEQLTVVMENENTAGMTWSGQTLDGYGDLSSDELSALNSLGSSDLLHGLSLIPLEAACLGVEQIEPQQLAALLFPLQMVLKYQVAERETAARELAALSDCLVLGDEEGAALGSTQIYLTAANPFPVVLGYFPFDSDGATEQTASELPGQRLANLIPFRAPGLASLVASSAPTWSGPNGHFLEIRDELGPCQAKCRGACGPDCTLNNCKLTADYRCEVDENGDNTGKISYLHIFDCGLHPACIKHDQCYDDCNQLYGCGTFKAAHCRHGGWGDGVNLPENTYCDKHTVSEENLINVKGWVNGFGPQTIRQVYVYTDEKLGYLDDLENCPRPSAEPEIVVEPTVVENDEMPVLIYEGVVSKAAGQGLELLGSQVVIEVFGEQVTAMIEITFKAAVKWQQDGALCTATMNRVYSGQGLLDVPIEIVLDLESSQDSTEGSDCGGVNVPLVPTQTLTGTFNEDGSFTGNIRNVWLVYALSVED